MIAKRIINNAKFIPRNIFDKRNKIVYYFSLFMILVGLAGVLLNTFETFDKYRLILNVIGFCNAGLFTIEYIVRIVSTYRQGGKKQLRHYLFSFMGLVDLVAILPFLLPIIETPFNSLMARGMVYFRLVVIFKLRRYSPSFDLLSEAVNQVKKPLAVAVTLPLMLAGVSAIFFYYIESPLQPDKLTNIGDAFYWVMITMTTVGYGDMTPVSDMGKVLSILTAISGVFIIAIPSGLLSSAFINILGQKRDQDNHTKSQGVSRAEQTHTLRCIKRFPNTKKH